MDFFDSHCHINAAHFDPDRDEVIASAAAQNVRMLTIGTCAQSSAECARLAAAHENVYAAIGIHPNDTASVADGDYDLLRALARENPKVVAIGETGLDYYHEHSPREVQREHFLCHIELARELGLPLVLHARQSAQEVLDLAGDFIAGGGRAVWHCFNAGKREIDGLLSHALEMGLYLGISGMITYEDQIPLRRALLKIPDRHLLLDTDSPYLIPRPRTLERNEPAQCARIAQELATLRGVRVEDIARITTRNACELFGLPYQDGEATKIAYPIRNSLYLNLTSRCTNDCVFCARNRSFVVKGHDISLEREPDTAEVIAAMGEEVGRYDEVVFCGYGEPTMCLETLKEVAAYLKGRGQRVRLNTNGLANLYYGRDIVPELVGLLDTVSISLNSADPAQYAALCRSQFGEAAFGGMLDFAARCRDAGIKTVLSVVEMPEINVAAAQALADNMRIPLRVRSFVDAG